MILDNLFPILLVLIFVYTCYKLVFEIKHNNLESKDLVKAYSKLINIRKRK